MFKSISNEINFPKLEAEINQYWEDNNTFQQSIKNRLGNKSFIFYDGPPFATGLPHYGHLLAGTIKDIIPRYQTMKGAYVERRFGWDCHGLPIEMEMQNKLNLKSRNDILSYGIKPFNEACRSNVLKYTNKWEKIVNKMGRWVDFNNSYQTMDNAFMESVWWVFKELYKKNLIYEGFKVLPYSWKASTILSNFEANLNYKSVQDPALIVKFKIRDREEFLLAWTTTPWTLISNTALCVSKDILYIKIKIKKTNEIYILSKKSKNKIFQENEIIVLEEFKGERMVNYLYEPLFPYMQKEIDTKDAFKVLTDDFVQDEEGVGIVHLAPAFGEDDYRVCNENQLPLFDPIDLDGNFNNTIGVVSGVNFKDANKIIIKELKNKNLIFSHQTIEHSYPFCWRTDTPLIYKAISTWFVKVESIKERIILNNKKINWTPEHLKEGRFGKWLENAKDWAISRNRYWGTPLPLWRCEKDNSLLCFGSIKELEQASDQKINDLHKHYLDEIKIKKDGKTYKKISEVLDCWFESGSMPFAQNHYPFKTTSLENIFPADFIAEGLDQTRGWFYTLLVISTALFNQPPFKQVIVNGLILAKDGKKMSKRLKNYPEVDHILDSYGADALRLYLISSGAIKGENLCFSEKGILEATKLFLLPLWHSFSFFISYANIDHWKYNKKLDFKKNNFLDEWLLSYTQTTLKKIINSMDQYKLYEIPPILYKFMDRLTNIYIRNNRRRFWKSENDNDKNEAYQTLYITLKTISLIIAPFTPFISEKIYHTLTYQEKPSSVHHQYYPKINQLLINQKLEEKMTILESSISLARSLRLKNKIKNRQPLAYLTLITEDLLVLKTIKANQNIIKEELNVKEIRIEKNENNYITHHLKANFRVLGNRYGKKVQKINQAIINLSPKEIALFNKKKKISISIEKEVYHLNEEDILVKREQKGNFIIANEGPITCILNTKLTPDLISEGLAKEFINRIQKYRKNLNLNYTDFISIEWNSEDQFLIDALLKNKNYILKETLGKNFIFKEKENSFFQDTLNKRLITYKIKKSS